MSCKGEAERAYFAGLFDGEGYAGIRTVRYSHTKTTSFGVQLSITNVDKAPLDAAKARWGGSISAQKRNEKTVYRWNSASTVASLFLADVLPYLRIKRQQALICLALQVSIDMCGKKVSADEWERRRQMQEDVRRLNQRTYFGEYISPVAPVLKLVAGGCMSCGCQSPFDNHGNKNNVTVQSLLKAADAGDVDGDNPLQRVRQVVNNIERAVPTAYSQALAQVLVDKDMEPGNRGEKDIKPYSFDDYGY